MDSTRIVALSLFINFFMVMLPVLTGSPGDAALQSEVGAFQETFLGTSGEQMEGYQDDDMETRLTTQSSNVFSSLIEGLVNIGILISLFINIFFQSVLSLARVTVNSLAGNLFGKMMGTGIILIVFLNNFALAKAFWKLVVKGGNE